MKKTDKEAKFFCESCGSEVPRKSRFCPVCGKFFASVRCPKCGHTGASESVSIKTGNNKIVTLKFEYGVCVNVSVAEAK